MGSDLGSAVKGFKDGMKQGTADDATAAAPAQAPTTIDVQVKEKV
jgi:sec-independent protein translocase protein TatA